ncbi:MAG TPA: TlpA family protein disulfide reductase [Leucothrix mucor]|uniref:TlpA family protein disulfide reductase n=1 Tax=Leucothrix mucor TaxID=45248 RepID=A0A7V2WVN3_LEUMU|nr:TlpA family protein disulfide reductase [Leucothrix mucor]
MVTSEIKHDRITATLLFIGLLVFSLATQAKPIAENKIVPNITFNDIKGDKHQLFEYRGKWLFLNFWAGYCSICQKEAPTLIRFQRNNKDNVTVLGINYGGESKAKIKEAMKRNKYNYLIVPDQNSITKIFSDVVATPTTIIISPQGRLIKKAVGQQSYQELSAYFNTYKRTHEVRIWDINQSDN